MFVCLCVFVSMKDKFLNQPCTFWMNNRTGTKHYHWFCIQRSFSFEPGQQAACVLIPNTCNRQNVSCITILFIFFAVSLHAQTWWLLLLLLLAVCSHRNEQKQCNILKVSRLWESCHDTFTPWDLLANWSKGVVYHLLNQSERV